MANESIQGIFLVRLARSAKHELPFSILSIESRHDSEAEQWEFV